MISELVGFVHNNQVVFFFAPVVLVSFQNFVQTAIGDKFGISVNVKIFEGVFPVFLHGRRVHYQYFSVVSSVLQ